MSDAFEKALDDAFGIGESIRNAKAALKNKKWDANEDGETAMISKALNPPSLGQRESSVAKRGKQRDWSWLYKALAGVLLAILVVIGGYYGIRIRAVKAKLAANADATVPKVPPSLGLGEQPASAFKDTVFGSVAAGEDLYAEWVVYLRWVAATIKGTPSAMREAVDSVRADVLHGLAVRVGQGYDTVSASDLKSAVGAGYAAYHKRYHAKRDSGLDRLRSCVDGALVAIHHALPRTRMRSTIGDLTARMFGESWLNKPSDEARVYAIYQLRDSLRVSVGGDSQFGRPGGKCLFLVKGACTNKCARDASVCETHKDELPPGGTDLERLAAHLAGAAANPIDTKVLDMAKKIEGMIAWPREGADAQIYDLVVAVAGGTGFGAQAPRVDLRSFLQNSLSSSASLAMRAGMATLNAASVLAGDDGQGIFQGGVPAPVVSNEGWVVRQLPTAPVKGVQLPTAPVKGSEDDDEYLDSFDSLDSLDSPDSAAASDATTPAVPALVRNSSKRAASAKTRGVFRRISSPLSKSLRDRSAEKRKATASTATTTATESVGSESSSAEPGRGAASSQEQTKKQNKRQAWLARTAQMRSERAAQLVSGADFLVKAGVYVKHDTEEGRAMIDRFNARAQRRRNQLSDLTAENAPFVEGLTRFLYDVPLDRERREQQATVALNWARRIVTFQETTRGGQAGKASVALYELIRKNQEIVRREIALTSIPLTVKEALASAERDYAVLRRAASTAAHAELDVLLMRLRVAFHEEPVLSASSADGGDPIRLAYDALVARGKKAFTERVGREGRELEDRVVHSAEAVRESTARWTKLVESMGRWTSRKIVYEHAVPGPRPSADLDVMLQAGMDSLVLRAEEAKKTLSIADQISGGKELATAFGGSSVGDVLAKLGETSLGSYVTGALGVGTGGWADTLISAGLSGVEMIALTKAITTAAKVGESLIMQLLAFVVEGLRMLIKALGGERWKIGDEIQNALAQVADSPERRKELNREKEEVARGLADLAKALPGRRAALTEDVLTLRAFLDSLDSGTRVDEAREAAEAKAKAKADEAEEAKAAAATNALSKGSTLFGTDSATGKNGPASAEESKDITTLIEPSDVAGKGHKPGALGKLRDRASDLVARGKKRGGDAYTDTGAWASQKYTETKDSVTSGVQRIPSMPKAIWELLKTAPAVLGTLIGSIWSGFWDVFNNGNILDLFGILVSKIQDAVAKAVSGTASDKVGDGWVNWGLSALALLQIGAVDFDAYMNRVREWCMSPATIRGLLTDPAGVLDGDSNDANRSLLTKHRAVAVPLVWFLFLFRAAQIIKAIFGTSLVTGLVCNAIGKMREKLGASVIMTVLGPTVDSIATSVGCEATDAQADEKEEANKVISKEIEGLSAALDQLRLDVPIVAGAARKAATGKAADANARADAAEAKLVESERRAETLRAEALERDRLASPSSSPGAGTSASLSADAGFSALIGGALASRLDGTPADPPPEFGRTHRRYRH